MERLETPAECWRVAAQYYNDTEFKRAVLQEAAHVKFLNYFGRTYSWHEEQSWIYLSTELVSPWE
jgi:hypothetical protein